MITIYTDGAAKGNPGPGGYGVIMDFKGRRKEFSQGYKHTTNNRMELMAVIIGLEAIKKDGWRVKVITDSKYVADAVSKGWLKQWVAKDFKGKKNVDLWKRFLKTYDRHHVTFHWIKGHAGHQENERCDELAVEAAQSGHLLDDRGFNPET